MANRITIMFLLAVLVAVAAIAEPSRNSASETASRSLPWISFLYGIPVLLATLLLARQRWALMACVMYATVGLALDISTLVQELTGGTGRWATFMTSSITGLVNFLLILSAGSAFMKVGLESRPPSDLPPSPQHPSASESAGPARSRQP